MSTPIAFVRPTSLEEAVATLAAYGDRAKVLGGCTAVAILLRQRLIAPEALVSLDRVDELHSGIVESAGQVVLGALTTHHAVERSAVVIERIPVLADAFAKVGNIRVRNVATVGGVVAEADYASDPPAVLLALDATVDIVGPSGRRSQPIGEFITGFYETTLAPDEIVTSVRVPIPAAHSRAVYEKFVTRSSEEPAMPWRRRRASTQPDHTCADLRVAIGAACEAPRRIREAESLAIGERLEEELARRIADQYANEIDALDDMRGSKWYRTEMIRVWVRRAILRAASEARGRAVRA